MLSPPCIVDGALAEAGTGAETGAGAVVTSRDLSTAIQVHGSAVGKYCSEFSGFLPLNSASFLVKVRHDLLQLA